MAEVYNHKVVEKKWQKVWDDEKAFAATNDYSKPKYYALVEFPYPSGQGLHVGHPRPYTALDIVARKRRMQGYNVLYPMGWDAFGLPTENYAIKNKIHPKIVTENNVKHFKDQLHSLGYSFDWDREINTTDPKYYKWTQWIFLKLFKAGLAYKKEMPINWCTSCKVGLANEEVVNGVCERCGAPVVRKVKSEWMLKITEYADKLIEGLNDVDYIERVKVSQRNWIGKSTGAEVDFSIKGKEDKLRIYTTRCDTLFGATYCVMAPEHELVDKITTSDRKEEILAYKKECASKSELERTDLNKNKTGVFTGAYAINPVNGKEIPIWISDYVLVSYGTGAIMAVPAHDERDYEFAKKFNLEIIPVISGGDITQNAYTGDGEHINSDFLNGLNKEDAINKMIEYLTTNKCGSKKINYRLREWIFARQRYWGEPVPIIHLENGKNIALEDKDLPLILPVLKDYKGKNGKAPLDNDINWKNVTINGIKGERETSTMPGAAGSSWYYLRYIDPHNDETLGDYELLKHWMPVDLYIGGPEHAVGHLLYSRMWNNYLYKKGLSPVKEPFQKLVHQGMILGENGIKMGKRFPKYVVNPSDIVNSHGADTLRLYEMFMGPLEADKPWSNSGIDGAKKFIDRIYRIFEENKIVKDNNKNLEKIYNQTIKKVTEDYESLNFNTAISQLMIFINAVYKEGNLPYEYAIGFTKILSPVCPFLAEHIWEILGNKDTITYEKWPTYNEEVLKEDNITIAIQVNGKLRDTINVSINDNEEEIKNKALNASNIIKHTEGKEIIKVIIIPKKIVNIVIK